MKRDSWLRLALLGCLPLGCPQLQSDDLTIVNSEDSRSDAGESWAAAASPPTHAGEQGDSGDASLGGAGGSAVVASATGGSAAAATAAGGSAAGGGATGASAAAGMGGTEEVCGSPSVPATAAACPAVCTRCEAGFCVIECHGQDACKEGELSCPNGLACRLECEGKSACTKANLICPDTFDCVLSCAGDDACKDARTRCTGNCAIDCSAGAKACEHLDVTCGDGLCQAFCQTDSIAPKLNCGSACSCEPCP